MTIIIGLIIAMIIFTVVDIAVQKVMFNAVDGLIIIMITKEIKTMIDNRE